MLSIAHLILVAILAWQLQFRVALLGSFKGLQRYFLSLGLTLFLVNWAIFLLYALLGWGLAEQRLTWVILLGPVLYFSGILNPRAKSRPPFPPSGVLRQLLDFRHWNYWFLFLAGFVLIRFSISLTVDDADNIWCNFNFVDTPFHLSVMNAFLESPHFPPVDLDMAPFPLKYHFMADFYVAHLVRLGLPALQAMWLMDLVSGAVLVVSLWSVFERWIRLSGRWIMLAGFIFLFLNISLINLIHYFTLKPAFFDTKNLFDGLLRFPYFNFESSLNNLIEPQRGLLFTLPVALLVLDNLFGESGVADQAEPSPAARIRTLQVFIVICLLPFCHIVAFPILALSALPALWHHRRWLLTRAWPWWGPALFIGVLQLLYLGWYGPPISADYSAWDATPMQPLNEYAGVPPSLRWLVFWFFVNGDFFFWSGLFAALALLFRRWLTDGPVVRLRQYLREWWWFFAVCGGFFILINFYRYSYAWGDSNKFVLFFNLGLTPVIVLGAAQWFKRRGRVLSYALWWFFFLLCATPATYSFYRNIIVADHDMILMYTTNDVKAADWLRGAMQPDDVILTGANNQIHFVTALAGRPTRIGIYGESNPYRQKGRMEMIRRIYEGGEFQLLARLDTKFVCLSAHERRRYRLNPKWRELMLKGTGVVFHSGGGPIDNTSVYIFDSKVLEKH